MEKVQQSNTTLDPSNEAGEGAFVPAPPSLGLPSFPPTADQFTRNDIILLQQAVTKGWGLSDDSKRRSLETAEWIRDHGRDPRVRLRALEFLLDVDKHQLEILKAHKPQEVAVDITSNGKPLGDYSGLTVEQLEARKAALQAAKALPPG